MAKAKPEGTTAKQIAEDLGISAADLRKHLRALKIEKPEGGWVWTRKADVASVTKQVKARIAELEKEPAKKAPAKEKAPAKKAPAKKAAKKPAKK